MANFPSNNAAFPGIRADGRSAFITRTYTHLVGASSDSSWSNWGCSNPVLPGKSPNSCSASIGF